MSPETKDRLRKTFHSAKQLTKRAAKAAPAILVITMSAFTGMTAADPISLPGLQLSEGGTFPTLPSLALPLEAVSGEMTSIGSTETTSPELTGNGLESEKDILNAADETNAPEGPAMGVVKSRMRSTIRKAPKPPKVSPPKTPKPVHVDAPEAPTTKPKPGGSSKESSDTTKTKQKKYATQTSRFIPDTDESSTKTDYTSTSSKAARAISSPSSRWFYDTTTHQRIYWTVYHPHSCFGYRAPDNNITVEKGGQNVSMDASNLSNETGVLIPAGNDPEQWLTAIAETSVERPGVGNVSYLRVEDAQKYNLTGYFAQSGVIHQIDKGKTERMLLDVTGLDSFSPKVAFEIAFNDSRPSNTGTVRTDLCKTGKITPIEQIKTASWIVNGETKVANAACVEITGVPSKGTGHIDIKLARDEKGNIIGARVSPFFPTATPTLG